MDLISRKQARLSNLKFYYTGNVCKSGHIDKRYVKSTKCYQCQKDKSKVWTSKNRERSNAIKKEYKIRNRDKYLASCREYSKRKRLDPQYRLSRNISKSIWESMKGNKVKRKWESIVGYTSEQLKYHLESQFNSNMTWDNYGSYWEIDHIKPLSVCTTFEEAWLITNLQPLECSLNRSKGNRYIG